MGLLDRDCRDPSSHQSIPPDRPEEKPYHAKRPHRKSRLGCRICKARKVKCDEARPSCRNCTSRKEICTYPPYLGRRAAPPQRPGSASASTSGTQVSAPAPDPTLSSVSRVRAPDNSPTSSALFALSPLPMQTDFSPAVPSTSSQPPAPLSRSPCGSRFSRYTHTTSESSRSTDLTIINEPAVKFHNADDYDMKLLWLYTTETYATLSIETCRVPSVDNILKNQIVNFAFQSPFLMDCILGLSALHMQSMHMTVPLSKAIAYRARAFSGYRKAIERGDPKDFPAILACSPLLCALSSEMFREPSMKPLYVLDWMVVWRGIGLVVDRIPARALVSSGLTELFQRPVTDPNHAAHCVPRSLSVLVTSIKDGDEDHPYIDAYYNALKLLGGLYLELSTGFTPLLSLRIITWLTFLPKHFLELGRKRRPRVLVILAHYLAFLKMIENVWWLVGIADRGIQDIVDHLGSEWYTSVSLPRAAVAMYDRVELARLINGNHAWEPTVTDHISTAPNTALLKLTMINDVGEEVKYDQQNGWIAVSKANEQSGTPSHT